MSKSAQPRSTSRRKAALVLCLCLPAALAVAQHSKPAAAPSPERLGASAAAEIATPPATARASAKAAERLREGTRLADEVGTFQNVGDRIVFVPGDAKDSYRVLENLALQRIGQTLDGTRGQQSWLVSGLITEFRGANYLLVTKASIQSHESGSSSKP